MLGLGRHATAVLDEEPDQVHMNPFGLLMQRNAPVLVLDCCVGAVHNEEPGQIHVNPFGRLIVVVCEPLARCLSCVKDRNAPSSRAHPLLTRYSAS